MGAGSWGYSGPWVGGLVSVGAKLVGWVVVVVGSWVGGSVLVCWCGCVFVGLVHLLIDWLVGSCRGLLLLLDVVKQVAGVGWQLLAVAATGPPAK